MGGTGLYIKYGKTGVNQVEVYKKTFNSLHIRCPDRELCFINDLHTTGSQRPVDEYWDELIILSGISSTWRDFGVEHMMVNMLNDMNKLDKSLEPRKEGSLSRDKVSYISDSGGFQLAQGKIAYLDPVKIVDWYNKNVDIGMSLDIPLFAFSADHDVLLRAARVQKQNNQAMLDNKADHLELMNVVHGKKVEDYVRFHEVVQTDKINKVSVGAMYSGSVIESLSNFIAMDRSPEFKQYNHWHLLGIADPRVIIPFVRYIELAKQPGRIYTSDSSSWLQGTRVGEYYNQRNINESLDRIFLGRKKLSHYAIEPNRYLPCSCVVCSRVKYSDIFGSIRSSQVFCLWSYHNMLEMVRYFGHLAENARTMDSKQFKELIKEHTKPKHLKEVQASVDYVETILNEGLEKANKRFQFFMIENHLYRNDEDMHHFSYVEEGVIENRKLMKSNILKCLEGYENKQGISHGKSTREKKKKGEKGKRDYFVVRNKSRNKTLLKPKKKKAKS
jgi:hypothetical protein